MRLELFNGLRSCPYFHLTCVRSLSRTAKRTLNVKRRSCNIRQIIFGRNQSKWNDVLRLRVATNSKVKRHDYTAFFAARIFAHRFFCAAAIRLRASADIVRFLRVGLDDPAYTPANAEIAALIPDNCFSTRPLSFFNCFTILDTFTILDSPQGKRS